MGLWMYYYRFFESEFEELQNQTTNFTTNPVNYSIFHPLFIRPLRFDYAHRKNTTAYSLNVVIETITQLKQFQFLKSDLKNKYGSHGLIILNSAIKKKVDSNEIIDATQKFNLKIYLISLYHFLTLILTVNSFINIYKGNLKKDKLLKFLSKAIYDHLYWKYFFKQYFKTLNGKNSCFLAFKGEKYPMRTVMRTVALNHRKFISLQHGFIGVLGKHKYSHPDTYFVWSSYFEQQLKKSGVKSEIVVSGNLQYKDISRPVPKTHHQRKVIFLPNSGNSNTSGNEVKWSTFTYLKMLKLSPLPFTLYIKPHPGDSSGWAKKSMEEFNSLYSGHQFVWLDSSEKVNFEHYDTVITMNSTSCIEANLFGTPSVILLSNHNELLFPDLISNDMGMLVNNEVQLLEKLVEIQNQLTKYSTLAIENSIKFFGDTKEGVKHICETIDKYLDE